MPTSVIIFVVLFTYGIQANEKNTLWSSLVSKITDAVNPFPDFEKLLGICKKKCNGSGCKSECFGRMSTSECNGEKCISSCLGAMCTALCDGPGCKSELQPTEGGSHRYTIKATGDEAKSYDFRSARVNVKTTTVLESIGHLVKSCLGGGVVGIHEAYMKCGLLTALFMNVFLGMFVAYCMNILIISAQVMYGRLQTPAMSYPDLAEAVLATGPFKSLRKYDKCFRYAVDLTIGIDLFGSCSVYAVIIARTIAQLVSVGMAQKEDASNIRIYLAGLLIPLILICMIISFKKLAPISIIADVFIVTVAISTIYYGTVAATKSPLQFPLMKNFSGLVEFVGVCVFSMEGVGVSLPIENHMENPDKFYLVLMGGMSTVAGMVMIIGFFGYWGFGETAKSPVTMNFPFDVFSIVLKVFMALMIYATFALNFWVPFDLVWYYLKTRHNPDKLWIWERVYRAIIVTVIVCVAIVFPNVVSFMGLLGSFCLSNMGFIFPAFIQLCVEWDDPGLGFLKWRLLRFFFITGAGTVLCILGTYFNALSMWKGARKGGD